MTPPVECPDPYAVVAAALRCRRETLTPESGMYRTHGWDSFGHVNVMVALEDSYGITISNNEILSLNTMKAILERCQRPGKTETK